MLEKEFIEMEKEKEAYKSLVRLCQAVILQRLQDLTSQSKKCIAKTRRHKAFNFLHNLDNVKFFCDVGNINYGRIERFLKNYDFSKYEN